MKITKEIIETICESKMEYIFLASLISSDNILTIEDAEKSLQEIDDAENAVKESNLSDEKKDEFRDFFRKGREILKSDIEIFEKNK